MNRTKVLGLGLSAIAAAMAHAQVLTPYNWTFTGQGDNGSKGLFSGQGQLTVQDGANVVAMTGTIAGFPITGLLPVNSFPFPGTPAANDNQFPITWSGISFTANGESWNLFSFIGLNVVFTDPFGSDYNNVGTFSYAPVPEPSTYAAFATLGLAGFGVWRRVRR